jgi:hypothetical protein
MPPPLSAGASSDCEQNLLLRTTTFFAITALPAPPRCPCGPVCYHGISSEVEMTDVLIRDVPDDVIAALDAHAGRLGLSRSEYVRRRLAQDAALRGAPVSVQDLTRFSDRFGDLADPDVMSQAWQ